MKGAGGQGPEASLRFWVYSNALTGWGRSRSGLQLFRITRATGKRRKREEGASGERGERGGASPEAQTNGQGRGEGEATTGTSGVWRQIQQDLLVGWVCIMM